MARRPITKPIKAGDGDRRHGTPNGYNNHGCRCRACADAWSKRCLDGGHQHDSCPACGRRKRVVAELCATCRKNIKHDRDVTARALVEMHDQRVAEQEALAELERRSQKSADASRERDPKSEG